MERCRTPPLLAPEEDREEGDEEGEENEDGDASDRISEGAVRRELAARDVPLGGNGEVEVIEDLSRCHASTGEDDGYARSRVSGGADEVGVLVVGVTGFGAEGEDVAATIEDGK